jgi:uncharacterized OsmC-like protein
VVLEVETRSVGGQSTALGVAGPFTLVLDRPLQDGGGGLGFSGGELLYLAVAGCVSNDLFREAARLGIQVLGARVRVHGSFHGQPAVSDTIHLDVELDGDAPPEALRALVRHVDTVAEVPNTLRRGTVVRLDCITLGAAAGRVAAGRRPRSR